jgi:hypothetical protein
MGKNFFLLLFIFIFIFLPKASFAVCPLCAIAAAGGVEVSRLLGVDDLITGIWIGGLIVSLGLWMADWFKKKNWLKPLMRELISLAIFYLLTIPFLSSLHLTGFPGNTFLGIDKIIFGIGVGSMVFFTGVFTDHLIRKYNHGKVLFFYQKVLIPVGFLALASLIFYKFLV